MKEFDPTQYESKLKQMYQDEDGNIENFNKEFPAICEILKQISIGSIKDIYEIIEPIGLGGAGIVFRILDRRLDIDRALKIPRPKKDELYESLRNEASFLNKIHHENIIELYFLDDVDVNLEGDDEIQISIKCPFFIMDYINNARDIRKSIVTQLEDASGRSDLKKIMSWLSKKFLDIAEACAFLHRNEIIHFDVKPSNILLDVNEKPLLTDLGYAKKKTDSTDNVVVGFTHFYAHPRLWRRYREMSNSNRVRKDMSPKSFEYIFDIYAFGKSILELLNIIHDYLPDIVMYNYDFSYLHLAACRMLDGENQSRSTIIRNRNRESERGRIYSYWETWIEIEEEGFNDIKYASFEEIVEDLKKLRRGKHYLESIEELNAFFPKRVQCANGVGAPFSRRVKEIIEHPVVKRLASILQLNLTIETYPTASHNRLEHSLGAFRNCCQYIQSLYNDQYNPFFKQLINDRDIKTSLVASLLHDLGQFPFAHEIEEVDKKFSHEEMSLKFLDNETKNRWNHTLKEVLEDEEWGWGIETNDLKAIIGKQKNARITGQGRQQSLFGDIEETNSKMNVMKQHLLRSIIDGPIDVDKLDYLIRDSQNCHLKYGELIDCERLLRNLTIVITKRNRMIESLSVGIYEKGQSAAESISFARYLLYQTVYWHRTARAVRAMLSEVIHAILISNPNGFYEDLEDQLGVKGSPKNVFSEIILDIFSPWTDDYGRELLKMIKERNYFKRIVTIHDEEPMSMPSKTIDKYRKNYKKKDFQTEFVKKISTEYQTALKNELPSISTIGSSFENYVDEISNLKNYLFDCPDPSYGTNELLRIIPEPQRLQKNFLNRLETGQRVSEVWHDIYFKLMNIAAKGRIFCHPRLREPIMTVLGFNNIKDIVKEILE